MSLFRRDSQHDPNPAVADPRRPASPAASSTASAPRSSAPGASSLIAKGTKVNGQISGGTELVIDGELDGEIHSDHLVTIGPGGRVKGKITARAARVQGRVVGDVRGTERVELEATATLEGDISAPRVTIAEGAFFKGTVEMTGGPSSSSSPERSSQQGQASGGPGGSGKPGGPGAPGVAKSSGSGGPRHESRGPK